MEINVNEITYFDIEGKKGKVIFNDNSEIDINDKQYSKILKDLMTEGISKQFKPSVVTKGRYKKIWERQS